MSSVRVKNDKCTVCEKTVYPMEKMVADGVVFHKTCMKCAHCQKTLGLGNFAALSGKYYCKPHFKQLFQTKGNYSDGFGEEKPTAKWAPQVAGYAMAGGNNFMKPSNSPAESPKRVESPKPARVEPTPAPAVEPTPTPAAEPAPVPTVEPAPAAEPTPEPTPEPAAEPEKESLPLIDQQVETVHYETQNEAVSEDINQVEETPNLAKRMGAFQVSDASPGTPTPVSKNDSVSSPATGSFRVKNDKCAVCEKTVYPMEKMVADGVVFHKTCMKCTHCNKTLGLGNFAALNGKYYCKPHFKQLFQTKGNYSDGFGEEKPTAKWAPQVAGYAMGQNKFH